VITKQELNPHNYPLSEEQQANFDRLFIAINSIRTAYGKPMIVTSGVRSVEDQTRIDKAAGRKPRLGSAHLKAAAVDIWDRDGQLWHWCLDNIKLLVEIGIYLEDRSATKSWVHMQILPPASHNRIFLP
jgi:uncharacterized protein YcbK (DUF882 family)